MDLLLSFIVLVIPFFHYTIIIIDIHIIHVIYLHHPHCLLDFSDETMCQ